MLEYYRKIIKESLVMVLVSSLIGLVSGTFLSLSEEVLYAIPMILLILPSLNSLIGDISTVLISRLTSHFYLGTIPPKMKVNERLKEDFLGLILTIGLGYVALIILGHVMAIATGTKIVSPFLVIAILGISVLLLFLILFVFLFACSVFLFKRGKDPNNALIPLSTSLADLLTPLFIIIQIQIFI